MAELYTQPVGNFLIDKATGGVSYTGDAEVDSYLNTLPADERSKELERYNAPPTGEEVAQALMQNPTYVPTTKEYKAYKEYQATKSTDIFNAIGMAGSAVVDDFSRAFQAIGEDPLKNTAKLPASLIEAFAQGTRNLYGMVAQSQDPDSLIFKWKDALSNNYSDEGYRQFLEAREFNRHSIDLATGKTTLMVDKDLVNHDVVQAASYIADPSLFIPFGGVVGKAASLVGMGERLAAATARASLIKNMMYAGALKYGAGVPLEFIGKATRNVIDKGIESGAGVFETVTGITAKDAANYVKTAGFGTSVSGFAGYPVPYASSISTTYLKAGIAAGAGEAINAVAEQMLKSQGRRGYMSFAEAALKESDAMLAKGGEGLSNHARKLLNVIDKADPMFAYAMEGLEGMAAGSAIGGGLGYLTGGEEGLGAGIGSGAVLGGIGGVAGRVYSDVRGVSLMAERKVQADMALELMKDNDPAKFTELSRMRAVAEANGQNIDAYIAGLDIVSPTSKWASGDSISHEAFLESRGQDPKTFDGFERNQDGSYKLDDKGNQVRLLDADGFEVPTMEQFNRGAGWTMTRNADNAVKVHINTTNYDPNVVPHELFHAIFREEALKPEFKNRLAREILGTFDETGKMVAPPTISRAESRAFFEAYIKAENKGNAGAIADKLSLLDKALAEYYTDGTMSVMSEDGKNPYLRKLTEEFGAYYFTQFIEGKRPDFLFRGGQYSGMRAVIEGVKTGWLDYVERKTTSVNPTFDFNNPEGTINPAFKGADGKRIRVSALDHLMTDIVKATSQTNRNGSFDFRTLSPEGQEAYVKANGLTRLYKKRANGKYERMDKPEQAAYDKARGIEIFKALGSLSPDALRAVDANGVVTHELIPVVDAKGKITHYEGTMSPAVLDHLQRTGYLDAPEKLRIQQLQDIAAGRTKSNIVEFIYHGREEGIAEGADVRVSGDAVTTKPRVVMVLGMTNKIKANGEHSFVAQTLDWRNISMRGDKLWADPAVRQMWGDDKSAFQGDFFRYLENASLPEGKRVPSAQLWQVDGEKKRNIMHQFAGFQATGVKGGKGGSYFNAPLKEIVQDKTTAIRQFRTEGMGKITLTNETVKFNPEGIKPIQMNFMPSEMSNEKTPTGNIRQTKDGWKFIESVDGVKVYRPDGTEAGKWKTLDEATAGAEKLYQKENPAGKPIPSVDNIRQEPIDAPETQEQYVARKLQNELQSNKDLQALAQDPNADPAVVQSSIEAIKAKLADEYNAQNTQAKPISLADSLNEVAIKYGWRVENGVLYNDNFSTPRPIHKVEIKGKRIRLLSLSDNKLRGSISEPSALGQYLEKSFFAELKPEQKAGRSQTFMMPAEGEQGGRTYSDAEFKGSFIGKYAQENPELVKGLSLKYYEEKLYGQKNVTLVIDKPQSKGQAGEQVGIVMAKIDEDGVANIQDTNVNPNYQSKGYSKVLMSELKERLKQLGVKEVVGTITDSSGKALKTRMSVFGNARIDKTGRTVSVIGFESSGIKELNTKENTDILSAYLAKIRQEGNNDAKIPMPQEVKDIADNISSFTKASDKDILYALKYASRFGSSFAKSVYTDLTQGKITVKQAVEKLKKVGDVYEYLRGLGDIRDERKQLANRLREVIGEKRAVSETDRRRENTSAERESRNTRYQMPSEGEQVGRTYSKKELSSSLIGKISKESIGLSKDLKVKASYIKSGDDSKGDTMTLYLSKNSGENIGGITVNINKLNSSAKIYGSSIESEYQGRGYGKILYSEAFERLRSLGIKNVTGEMADKQGRPAMIRKSVAGKTTVSSSGLLNTKLDPNARYMPSEQAQAWRDFKAEPTTEGNSIFKNAMNFVIIQANNKFKVYNPQKALLGIYTDLDQAKRRVQREEPKQR